MCFSETYERQGYMQLYQEHRVRGFMKCLTLTVLIRTIDAQWDGMGDVGSARYEPAVLPPCPTIRVLSYSSW